MVKSSDRKLVKDVKVIPGEEVFTHHKLVVCDLAVKSRKEKKKPYIPKLKVWKLKDPDTKNSCLPLVRNQQNVRAAMLQMAETS